MSVAVTPYCFRYIGEHMSGQKQGQGFCTYPDESVHKGSYQRGVKSGFGTCTWANGNVFSGAYENDRMHGSGMFKWASGHVHNGEFANDRRHGQGVLIYADGKRQDGLWHNGNFVAESPPKQRFLDFDHTQLNKCACTAFPNFMHSFYGSLPLRQELGQ